MTLTDFTRCNIEQAAVHRIGNRAREEELRLSTENLDLLDDQLRVLLFSYFLTSFFDPEFYNFNFTEGDLTLNPLYNYDSQLFEDAGFFHDLLVKITQINNKNIAMFFLQDKSNCFYAIVTCKLGVRYMTTIEKTLNYFGFKVSNQ